MSRARRTWIHKNIIPRPIYKTKRLLPTQYAKYKWTNGKPICRLSHIRQISRGKVSAKPWRKLESMGQCSKFKRKDWWNGFQSLRWRLALWLEERGHPRQVPIVGQTFSGWKLWRPSRILHHHCKSISWALKINRKVLVEFSCVYISRVCWY